MLKLALRNILRNRVRTGMTLSAIVFGIVGLILSGGFVQDVYYQLGEALIHSQSGHLQVAREGFHAKGTRSPERYLIDDSEGLAKALGETAGVADVMARVSFSGLVNNGRTDWPIVGEGVEPEKEAALGSQLKITAGRQMTARDENGILVGQGVARALKLEPGGQVTLVVNTAEGALNSLEFVVIGVFQSFSSDFDARAVRIPLAAAQQLLGNNGVNTLVVSLQHTEATDVVAQALRKRFAGAALEVLTWVDLNDFYASTVALYERQFGVLQLIMLVLVLLSVINSVNMSAFERVGEFGTMMALGTRNLAIFRQVIVENLLLGLAGGLAGGLVGVLLALLISAVGIPMPPPPNANLGYVAYIRIDAMVVFSAVVIGFAATALASLLPAWRVSRIPVVDALRQNY